MPKGQNSYPEEFRANAVRLMRSSGKSQRDLARELGISPNSLREWAKRTDLDAGRRMDGLTSDEREELARLRRENRVLIEEREILKKAAAGSRRQRNALRRSGYPPRSRSGRGCGGGRSVDKHRGRRIRSDDRLVGRAALTEGGREDTAALSRVAARAP